MGLFNRKPSPRDMANMMAIRSAEMGEKWLYFCKTLPFKADVGLGDRIAAFSIPARDGLRKNEKLLRGEPDQTLMMIIISGIKKSGTHSVDEIAEAVTPPGSDPAVMRQAILQLPV